LGSLRPGFPPSDFQPATVAFMVAAHSHGAAAKATRNGRKTRGPGKHGPG